MNISGKAFLVTGGAGLIGSFIVEGLLERGASKVVVIDNLLRGSRKNLEQALTDSRVEFVEGDICDRELMSRLIASVDGLFHMAALRIKHCIQEPRLAAEVMFTAPIHMLLEAVDSKLERVVTASSSSIYGQAETFPTNEDHHPYDDVTFYGAGKLGVEGVLRALHETNGLSYATMRFFNVYGPRMDIHGVYTEVMIRWMDRIRNGDAPLVFGDGSDSMDFTYVADAARACIKAMETDDHHGAYNVGTGVSTDLNDLSRMLVKAMGADVEPEYRPADTLNAVRKRICGTEKATREIGFTAEVALDEGLEKLVDWWKEQPPQLT